MLPSLLASRNPVGEADCPSYVVSYSAGGTPSKPPPWVRHTKNPGHTNTPVLSNAFLRIQLLEYFFLHCGAIRHDMNLGSVADSDRRFASPFYTCLQEDTNPDRMPFL